MEDFAARRREKQPLEYPSAGSTFKRPEGYFAGKLIEDAGLKDLQSAAPRCQKNTAVLLLTEITALLQRRLSNCATGTS